ncbi:hypothetical protein DTL21_08205 [Bremerella cremea]|uniref:Uncharacterized protein n=1 Tax=Blastopirellula marina TaxID=124 RepID=A0A2S8FUQ6_9BACT|nr:MULTISPECIES: hypothetical protein [Pirellulaceae]PQO35908.1 hypothetical protein C5Y83_08200 [Blastopirellula marina]RCS48585.1 hypothetical protein DTL21_08205 [Bremerella cremea]
MAPIKIFNTTPAKYGEDYQRGWIGFNHADSWFSKGIAQVEQWKQVSDVTVSHVFVVTGEDEVVEAAYPKGVVRSKLSYEYWPKEDRYVIFRKPKGLTPELADRIAETAEEQLGTDFDYATTANLAIQKNFLGWITNWLTSDEVNRAGDYLVESDSRWLCSALGAYCLKSQKEYDGIGVLENRPGMITPQELFECDELFEPVQRTDGSKAPVQIK